MKRFFLLTAILSFASATLFAQNDMYFTPKKKTAEEKAAEAKRKAELEAYRQAHTVGNTFYIGSNRNVDEYNRRRHTGSDYAVAGNDSVASDIIDFTPGTGVYPDSIIVMMNDSIDQAQQAKRRGNDSYNDYSYDEDDFTYSRQMNRFYGYAGPYWGPWNRFYYSPAYRHWVYDSLFMWDYDPWIYGFYDPWYYGNYGWYDPWYYGGFGYGYHFYPHYWGGTIHVGGGNAGSYRGGPGAVTGSHNHGYSHRAGSGTRNSAGTRRSNSRASNMTRSMSSRDRATGTTTKTAQRQQASRVSRTEASRATTNDNTPRTTSTPSYGNTSSMRSSGGGFGGGGSFGGGGGSRGGGGHGGGRR